MTFGLILVKYEVDPQLASLKLGLPTQLTRTVLFVFGVSRLNSRCRHPASKILDLHSLHRQQSHFLRLFEFYSHNTSWIYGNSRPARRIPSPFLMLVAGLKAFCGQPCGWVIDQCKYTMILRRKFREIGDSASLQRPGFHPPPFPFRKSLRCCSITRGGGVPADFVKICGNLGMSFAQVETVDRGLTTSLSISIVIPVHNGGESFRRCLVSLKQYIPASTEVIVVVDGGTDHSCRLAEAFGAKVIQLPIAGGPAQARNLGADVAAGDILFFVDADVTLRSDTLNQVIAAFQKQPELAALIGSYDDAPGSDNFLSQYKNLFHHYTHQMGSEEASTFWGACGAIRRDLFLTLGGFDRAYRHPSVEDIELGYRLKKAGYSIRLCKQIQVKHLKCWRVVSLLRAEVFYRAVPWTELIWRDRQFNNDLNLSHSSRLSLLLTYALLLALIAIYWWLPALVVASAISLALLFLNWSVYRFFYQKRGGWFALRVIPWHWLYFLYGGFAFALGTLRYCLGKLSHARFSQA